MSLERRGNKSLMMSLPESITCDIQDMDYFELEQLLFCILGGTVELKGIPKEWDTWEKKLKPLSDIFYSKYGVILHVDENKNVFLYNLSQDLLDQSHEKYELIEQQGAFVNTIEGLMAEGKTFKARDECLVACEKTVLYGVANYYLGKIYTILCQYEDAIVAFQRSFDDDYKRIESLDGIASISFRRAEYSKAIDMYEAIQDEKGYDGKIWCNIGVCYIRLKQYKRAIEYFDKAITADISDAFAYYNKGVALYMLEMFEHAKENMEFAIGLDPNNEVYKREYIKCFKRSLSKVSVKRNRKGARRMRAPRSGHVLS